MKKIFTLAFTAMLFTCFNPCNAQQAPGIAWQNAIGGSSFNEYLISIQQTSDHGYILGGSSQSNISGDKTENCIGNYDYWIVKTDSAGNIQWQNTIGGSGYDFLGAMQQTTDGGYICGGSSSSNISGDKTENSLGTDYWIVKLDPSGNIQWQNTIGGSNYDGLNSIQQTSDGGYILGGWSDSGISGDKTENSLGGYDFWVIKLNSTGNIQWQNTIGGDKDDKLLSIQQTSDGGYICGGWTLSDSTGDMTEHNVSGFYQDCWVIKLSSTGNIQWQNSFGGSYGDGISAIRITSDHGYICGGFSSSNMNGDKTEMCFGATDYWVVKLDSLGNIQWQKTLGGSDFDALNSVQQTTDGGYLLGGFSDSDISGNKTENSKGGEDYWIVKLDHLGNLQWQKTIGGSWHDRLYSLQQTTDGGYTLGGYSQSGISGDKTEDANGGRDYWIVKLFPDTVCTTTITASGNTTICQGSSVLLNANPGAGISYQWYKNGVGISGAGLPAYTVTTSGTYYVIKTLSCGSVTSNSIVVTVNPMPSATTTPNGSINLCSGTGVTLQANTGTGLTYQWKKNYMNIVGATNSSYFANSSGIFIVLVTAVGGCYAVSTDVLITVNSLPSATITPNGNVNICSASTILQANTGTGLTYQWKKNNVNVTGATSSNYTVTASGTYTVVVTNSCGSSTAGGTVVTLSTTIPATPAGISATGGNTKVCPGDSKVYSISTVTGATSYTWTPPVGASITAGQGTKTVTVNYTAAFTASDTIHVVAVNACGSSAQRILKITRNTPSTPAAITGSAFGVCNLSNVPYSITNVAGMTYNWSFNTGTASVAGGQGTNTITANFNSGFATGTLSVSANNACGMSSNRTLSIKAIPATPASITGATIVCANQQGVPYSISPIASAVNYTWSGPTGSHVSDGTTTSSGTNLITTATNVTVNFGNTAGKINARANNACGSGSYKNITVTFTCREIGQENFYEENDVTVFPNPTEDDFTLTLEQKVSDKKASLYIHDIAGRVIFIKEEISTFTAFGKNFAAGVYYATIIINDQKQTIKIIKTK